MGAVLMLVGAGGAYATMIVCALKQAKDDMKKKVVRRNERHRHF